MVQPVLFHRTPTTTAFVLQMVFKYWLLKAEPDSRVVKGKDVKARFLKSSLILDPISPLLLLGTSSSAWMISRQ